MSRLSFSQRLLADQVKDLDEQRQELTEFITRSPDYENLSLLERSQLTRQSAVMRMLSDILHERLDTALA